MNHSPTNHAIRQTVGSSLPVLWFVILFLATLSIAVVALSASQLQSRLLAYAQSDAPISVWQIERIRKSWNIQNESINVQSTKVSKALDAWTLANGAFQEAEGSYLASKSRYMSSRDDFAAKISVLRPDFNAESLAELTPSIAATILKKQYSSLMQSSTDTTQKSSLEALEQAFSASKADHDQLFEKASIANKVAIDTKRVLEDEKDALIVYENKLNEIVNPTGTLSSVEVQRVYDLVSEFAFMEKFALGTLYKFAVLPNEFLIIVLVVTMGVLGSTLQLTHHYFRNGGVTQTSLFFLRPMLGAITAIVVFILLKAGVLVVTDSAKLGEVAPLNPFFISFVGIVSGLLSEDALETIRRVGESWFKNSSSDVEARWASGVKASLDGGKTLEGLAQRLGVSLDLVTEWVDEKKPVPVDMQKLIATWLDKDVRLLFTDIAPQRVL